MRILKSKFIRRIGFLGFCLIIIGAALFSQINRSQTNKPEGQVAGVSTILTGLKFCDDPTNPDQRRCTSFISNVSAAVPTPYQDVAGAVAISGKITAIYNTELSPDPATIGLTLNGSAGGASAGNATIRLIGDQANADISVGRSGLTNGGAKQLIIRNNTDNGIVFASGATELMRITSDGKIGIGTATPRTGLNINMGASIYDGLAIDNPGGSKGSVGITSPAGQPGMVFYSNSANGNLFQTDSNGYPLASLDSKRANIIRYRDKFQLDANGTASLRIRDDNVVEITGTFFNNSDIRSKKNIEPLSNVLEKLSNLNGVTYNWKEPGISNKKEIGMIAQEVEKVFPELVTTDTEGYKSVSYVNFTAVLLEAIKEQQQEINQLKQEIQQLKNKQ